MARYIGPVCRLCRREGMKLFLKGERCYTEKCAIEKRNLPPGPARQAAQGEAGRATACSCARSRRSSASTACSRTSSAATSRWPTGRAGSPARRCCSCSSGGSTTSSTGSGSRRRARRRASSCATATSSSTAARSTSRRTRSRRATSSRSAAPARRTPPIQHAMEEVKGRGIPEWLLVRRRRTLTGRVTSLPTREQINLPVQEQLIVELYASKDRCAAFNVPTAARRSSARQPSQVARSTSARST